MKRQILLYFGTLTGINLKLTPIVHEVVMNLTEQNDQTIYKVVINHEEQYSIWWSDRENPLGWQDVGKSGTKQECLDYIETVWTDMRPLSLRKKMDKV